MADDKDLKDNDLIVTVKLRAGDALGATVCQRSYTWFVRDIEQGGQLKGLLIEEMKEIKKQMKEIRAELGVEHWHIHSVNGERSAEDFCNNQISSEGMVLKDATVVFCISDLREG